jgi:hypothetical protein
MYGAARKVPKLQLIACKIELKHVQSGHLPYKDQKDINIENICSIQSARQVS